jgi:hypothetical protein
MRSCGWAGEAEATFIFGMRRKKDEEELSPQDRERNQQRHQNTVTLDIPKNKRIGGRITDLHGIDLYLNPANGAIREITEYDYA